MTTGATEPARVQQLTAADLKAMIDRGEPFEFIDVRTPEERALACITGSRLLDQAYGDQILGMDRNTALVLQCHHGIRSQAAAEFCVRQGFTRVYNLVGGIDAWSLAVDPLVPRY
ncbi:MAG: rhodanese-like domain-containing protein [Vicinamibacterales bacterium]